jgi:mono/diheme cytochrome c family protein
MPAFQNPAAPALTNAELGDVLAYIRGLGQHTAVAQLASGGQEAHHE